MNSDNLKFANSLKNLRKEKNITINQLSKKLNIPKSDLLKYENADEIPNKKVLNKIADFYNITVDELFNYEYKEKVIDKKIENNNENSEDFKNENNNKRIIIEKKITNLKINAIFKKEKGLLLATLLFEIVVFLFMFLFSYIINSGAIGGIISFVSALTVLFIYKVFDSLFVNTDKLNDDDYLKFNIKKHSLLHHIYAMTIMTLILSSIMAFYSMSTGIDIIGINWFITYTIIVFIVIFVLDLYTYSFFFDSNGLYYPKWYQKIINILKDYVNLKSLLYVFIVLILNIVFVSDLYKTHSDSYFKIYDVILDYPNALFYISLVFIGLSIIFGIIIDIKNKPTLLSWSLLFLGALFNLISLSQIKNDLNNDIKSSFTIGYRIEILVFVGICILFILSIIEFIYYMFNRKLAKRK